MNALIQRNTVASRGPRLLYGLAAPLTAAILLALPGTSIAGLYVSATIAPPPIPVYEQPPMPGDGYLWTPGYWAYGSGGCHGGYFWVPGTWVRPPSAGVLWTPGYWAWSEQGNYVFNAGYWAPHIGFYGGVNYGFGYIGIGYQGGYWTNGAFFYNRGFNNFGSITVTNIYNKTVINNVTINNTRVSFNGGVGGITARATADEELAEHDRHIQAVEGQQRQVQVASRDDSMYASSNHGAPVVAATSKPGEFTGPGVVAAHPVSEQDRAQVDKAEQAKPVGPARRSLEAASSRSSGSSSPHTQRSATHALASAGAGHPVAPAAGAHQPARGPAPDQRSHPMAQPHPLAQPHQNAQPHPGAQPHLNPQPRPMANPHATPPHPAARPRPPQHAPAPPKKDDKEHH